MLSQDLTPYTFLCFSLGIAALRFGHPEPIALLSIVFAFIYLVAEGSEYRKIVNVYLPKNSHPIRYILVFWRLKVFIASIIFLSGVASGNITEALIYNITGYEGT